MPEFMTVARPTERLHALDTVRAFALLLAVAIHASLAFLPGPALWPAVDANRSTILAVFFFASRAFAMSLFFLIAGFFGRMSLERKGLVGFIRDRLLRIALPLPVFWLFTFLALRPLIPAITKMTFADVAALLSPPGRLPLFHLWFLWMLILFYAGALLIRLCFVRLDRKGLATRFIDRGVALLPRWWMPIALAIPGFLSFTIDKEVDPRFGVPVPDGSLHLNLVTLATYGTAFAAGWALQRTPDLLLTWRRNWVRDLIAAIALIAACLAISGIVPPITSDLGPQQRVLFLALYTVSGWTVIFAVLGIGLEFASDHSPWRRYLADASYWIYLVHLPITIAVQQIFASEPWYWPVKFLLTMIISVAIPLAVYAVIVRGTWIGAWLNGRRVRPSRTVQPADAGQSEA